MIPYLDWQRVEPWKGVAGRERRQVLVRPRVAG